MADVQVNQSPGGTPPQPVETGGGSSAAWAIVVIVLLAIIAWFVFGSGMVGDRDRDTTIKADVKIERQRRRRRHRRPKRRNTVLGGGRAAAAGRFSAALRAGEQAYRAEGAPRTR